MGIEIVTVLLGPSKVPVKCIQSTSSRHSTGVRPTVIFEHSWNIPPLPDYQEFLEKLDERVNVHALEKNGLNNFDDPPVTIAGYAKMTCEYLQKLIEQHGAVNLIGHSMGFLTAYEATRKMPTKVQSLVGVSPLLPNHHSFLRFSVRLLGMTAGMLFRGTTGSRGRSYVIRSMRGYVHRALRKPLKSFALINELAKAELGSELIPIPTCIIRGQVDELVPYSLATAAKVARAFSHPCERVLTGPYDRHSLPVVFGQRAASEVLAQYQAWRILE